MVDASILIPTHRHVRFLPFALESALDQDGVSVELLVVGDGVEDATREVLSGFASDPRVRFFDFPKGPRNGEAYRHEVLAEARGRFVTYLCDDDLLLRDHTRRMQALLDDADIAHPLWARVTLDGAFEVFPWNYGREAFREIARTRIGSVGLTGVAHTLEAYRRLPFGWRTTPPGMPTDHYMWLQWLELPGLRAVQGDRLTLVNLPDPLWRAVADDERAAELERWLRRSRSPGWPEEFADMERAALRKAGEDYHLWAWRESRTVAAMRATRMWRVRSSLGRLRRRRL